MPHRKKIALIFPKDSESLFDENSTLTFGGANVQMFLIGQELAERKEYNTYFLINDYVNVEPCPGGHNIIKTFRHNDFIPAKIIKFNRILRDLQPDYLIQRGLTYFSCLLALYCRIRGIKLIFMYAHDREAKGRLQKNNHPVVFYPLLTRCAHRLICQNEQQLDQLSPSDKEKAGVIYSGYRIPKVAYSRTGRNMILWVGRLVSWKRAELMVKLAELNPEYHFVMIAPQVPHEQEYADTIYSLAAMVPNLEIIQFVPFSEVEKYFKQSLLFINTSIQEGFPNTFIQAMKNMVPVLSLNVNPDNILTRLNCGMFCNNSFAIMNHSLRKLLKNKPLHKQMAENAHKYVKNNHDIRKTVSSIVEFVE